MNDPEFRQMLKKAIIAVSVALIFAIPLFFVFKNKLIHNENELIKDINNKSFLLYVTKNNCKICKTLKKELDSNNIKYKILNKDENIEYQNIIIKLDLNDSQLDIPALIYIKKGEVISYISDIESEEVLNSYLKNYK